MKVQYASGRISGGPKNLKNKKMRNGSSMLNCKQNSPMKHPSNNFWSFKFIKTKTIRTSIG
jgi:hypothetical protein